METIHQFLKKLRVLVKKYYFQITGSIAFIPSGLAILFTGLILLLLWFDSTEFAKRAKDFLVVIEFRDPQTARNIAITLVAGILSLTVFSFSMVMVMLGQTMNNSSPKIMDMLIKEKSQQIILGCFIGTILYCLILSLNIKELEDTVRVPDFSFFFGILLGIFNIFLFIYFINNIAQNIKPKNIISRIHQNTRQKLLEQQEKSSYNDSDSISGFVSDDHEWFPVNSPQSGYLQDIESTELVGLAKKYDAVIRIDKYFGTYVVKDTPLLSFSKKVAVDKKLLKAIDDSLIFYVGEDVEQNFNYGFQQLMEIAIKALSPGINDPGTAMLCIDSLSDCLAWRMKIYDKAVYRDQDHDIRLITKPVDLNLLLHISIDPIRYYGRNDSRILVSLLNIFTNLGCLDNESRYYRNTFNEHASAIIREADLSIKNTSDRNFINTAIAKMNGMDNYYTLELL